MNSYSNYWVLHVTDTVDYTTLQVPERPQSQEETIQVYPNPCNSTVRIVLPKKASIDKVQIYNAIGQLVNTGKQENEINVKDLPEGVYLLRITDEKGINYTERIIITK